MGSQARMVVSGAVSGGPEQERREERWEPREQRRERRQQRRFAIQETVSYKTLGRGEAITGRGVTLDFSSGGIAFTTEDQLPIGRKIEVSVDWPAKLYGHRAVRFVATGRIVRSGRHQAAAKIQHHDFETGPALDDDLPDNILIARHESIDGVDCCVCIVGRVDGDNVELQCNECRAVVGVVQIDVFRGLLRLDYATAICPQCGKENTFRRLPQDDGIRV